MNLTTGLDLGDDLATILLQGRQAREEEVCAPSRTQVPSSPPAPPPQIPCTDEVHPPIEAGSPVVRSSGGAWTIPMLCAGIAIIAACVLVPLADENRQIVYERTKLELDLAQIKKQVAVNDEFLKKLGDDPTLAERLAQRQMRSIEADAQVVELDGPNGKVEMSPFMLVSLPPPTALEPYSPVGGWLTHICLNGKVRLFLVGIALMLCAAGLVNDGTRSASGAAK